MFQSLNLLCFRFKSRGWFEKLEKDSYMNSNFISVENYVSQRATTMTPNINFWLATFFPP